MAITCDRLRHRTDRKQWERIDSIICSCRHIVSFIVFDSYVLFCWLFCAVCPAYWICADHMPCTRVRKIAHRGYVTVITVFTTRAGRTHRDEVLAIGVFFFFLSFALVTFVADVRILSIHARARTRKYVTRRTSGQEMRQDVFSLMKTCPFRLYKSSVIDQKPRPAEKNAVLSLYSARTWARFYIFSSSSPVL